MEYGGKYIRNRIIKSYGKERRIIEWLKEVDFQAEVYRVIWVI